MRSADEHLVTPHPYELLIAEASAAECDFYRQASRRSFGGSSGETATATSGEAANRIGRRQATEANDVHGVGQRIDLKSDGGSVSKLDTNMSSRAGFLSRQDSGL